MNCTVTCNHTGNYYMDVSGTCSIDAEYSGTVTLNATAVANSQPTLEWSNAPTTSCPDASNITAGKTATCTFNTKAQPNFCLYAN